MPSNKSRQPAQVIVNVPRSSSKPRSRSRTPRRARKERKQRRKQRDAHLTKAGVNLTDVNYIAKARTLPEVTPAIRLPYVNRALTDVKHLWSLGSIAAPEAAVEGVTVAGRPVYLFDEALPDGAHFLALGKSPVAPLVYKHVLAGLEAGCFHYARWTPASFVQAIGVNPGTTDAHVFTIPTNGIAVLSGAPVEYTPDAAFEYLQPGATSATSGYSTANSGPLAGALAGLTWTASPDEMAWTPTFVSGDRYYSLNHSGHLRIRIMHGTPAIPVPGQVRLRFALLRYNGEDSEDVTIEFDATMATSEPNGGLTLDITNNGVVAWKDDGTSSTFPPFISGVGGNVATGEYLARPGYYRLMLRSVRLGAGSSTALTYQQFRLIIGWVVPRATNAAQTAIWVQPALRTYFDASYMFRSTRVTAASLRLTNNTPKMFVGGNAFACRMSSGSSFRSGGWYNATTALVRDSSGHMRAGYAGNAADGLYTWMELTDLDETFRDCSFEMPDAPVLRPRVDLDLFTHTNHIFLVDTTRMPLEGIASFTARFRVDLHVEFMSTSSLATLSVAVGSSDVLAQANTVLAAAPLCYENPGHLAKIWNAIRRTAMPLLKASTSAAARVALEGMLGML